MANYIQMSDVSQFSQLKFRALSFRLTLFQLLAITCFFTSTYLSAQTIDSSNFQDKFFFHGFYANAIYPNDPLLYPIQKTSAIAGIMRYISDGQLTENWQMKFNLYQSYLPKSLVSNKGLLASVERSGFLQTNLSQHDHALLAVDQLAFTWSRQNINLTLGRQAINLANTFYFTPNDFFSPFAANTFFKEYKAGVDGLRAEIGLGDFSQLTFIAVLGYQSNTGSNTWDNQPDFGRNSYLINYSNSFGSIDGSLLLGKIRDKTIIGTALQGELFNTFGLRLEGHLAFPKHLGLTETIQPKNYQELCIGIEKRWENTFELRMEWFYHGFGHPNSSQYYSNPNNPLYQAQHYTALGASYEFHPLLTAQALLMSNLDDHSHLLALYANYSLSDESELSLNLSLPIGAKPHQSEVKKELSAYPRSISIEFRFYF